MTVSVLKLIGKGFIFISIKINPIGIEKNRMPKNYYCISILTTYSRFPRQLQLVNGAFPVRFL